MCSVAINTVVISYYVQYMHHKINWC